MSHSSITGYIEKIAAIESVYENLVRDYSEKQQKRIISSPCFFIPPEINSAFDIITLKIPEFILKNAALSERIRTLYDAVIIPGEESPCGRMISTVSDCYVFRTPEGYGEDSAVSLHNEIALMLKTLFDIDLKSINIESLQRETLIYEKLRRMVRSISALRAENRTLLSNTDLSLIFETALILPPVTAIEYIAPVLEEMRNVGGQAGGLPVRGMLYGGKNIPSSIADYIEESGIAVVEDDSCTGRRVFDMSLNAESEYIFYELLDAYSYRPMSPCIRPVNERYELLYKLLRNYNIDTVIFYRDQFCSDSEKDIEYLRIRMMRDGIDPLVIDDSSYREVISGYVSRTAS